ncbi:hypothetical protein [Methylobacterium persicinum]|uniref:Uncharacterized protein n=1 Tax=Methylobacterium persicinum TaxID=374426 RepID=A0ABU0HL74_9HYPH|nr:hypothetical protein [Methylobacterium persicinum]MDQ0443078.1 hypothetical protein [Methylobacterium persicinum]GJE39005.1 hypothetical protein KHHGKMAE_3083 [Methylobacterium persicinum]
MSDPSATIAILIGTPAGARLLASATERDAARTAELFLLRLPPRALPAPLWVQCGDRAAGDRLSAYLSEFQAERVRERDGVTAMPDPDRREP